LGGGLLGGNIILVYGEAETGKTTLAIQCAVSCARMGYKTVFIDSDNTFFPRRMAQISGRDFDTLAPQIILMRPEYFKLQSYIVDRLNEFISQKVGLIVVDTITGLYREELVASLKKTFTLNREMNLQMAQLAQIAKTRKIATLIISQVRSVISENYDLVESVASRVLGFWADIEIALKPTRKNGIIWAEIKTHNDEKPSKPILLKVGEKGLHNYKM
jgi:RecA/RadA recombinase